MVDEKGNNHDKLGRFAPKGENDSKTNDESNIYQETKKQDYIYNEKDYSNYGWTLENNIIPYGKYKDFESKFAEAVSNPKSAYNRQKSSQGEYMIPVNDIFDSVFEGVNNTIVYAKGKIESPEITRILNIDEYDETNLDKLRRLLNAGERREFQPKVGKFYRFYYTTDFRYDEYIKRSGKKNN